MKLSLTIRFHGPFRVATGTATRDAAVSVDQENLLPTESLKGVMRASANRLLPGRSDLVRAVFGTSGRRSGSPWHWDAVTFSEPDPVIESRIRIAIDAETNVASSGALARTEEVWTNEANFVIRQRMPLNEPERYRHSVILRAAAGGVHSLGADRRRGHGWVSITADPPLDEDDFALLDQIIAEASA